MGRTPLPSATSRPLATLAVLAFNQEQYVRYAIEGALAQTYSPLEVILSDDCSTDATFRIMQEMASSYEGPHSLQVRCNGRNLGLVNHIAEVTDVMRSDYLFVAAGDDISLPYRVEATMPYFLRNNCSAVSAIIDVIDESGRITKTRHIPDQNHDRRYVPGDPFICLVPPSAAYSKKALQKMLELTHASRGKYKIHNEDFLMWSYLNIAGNNILFHDRDALVRYRKYAGSISSWGGAVGSLSGEIRRAERMQQINETNFGKLAALEEIVKGFLGREDSVRDDVIQSGLSDTKKKYLLSSAHLPSRIEGLRLCRTLDDFLFGVPRIFGPRVFGLLRYGMKMIGRAKVP